jgi:PAS domain S-box-containing protein
LPTEYVPTDTITVLHVDDDPSFTDLTSAFLRRIDSGLTVLEANEPEEALEMIQSEPVDCIVSDYDMPSMTGIALLEAVRKHCDLPFILLTGKGSEEIASEAISAGVTDYLQKGSASEQYELLANRIRTLTEKHRTEHHIQQVYEAINVVGEGISLVNDCGDFIYVNDAYAATFGYAREELVGQHWAILYRDSDDVAYLQQQVLTELDLNDTWEGKTRQVRKDGSEILTDHTLAYTSEGLMACLVTEMDADPPNTDSPVVEAV